MIVIPVPQNKSAARTWRVRLDGVEYTIEARFNSRSGRWYLGLLDIDGNRLYGQVKAVCHYPLFRLRTAGPPGLIFALDTSSSDTSVEGLNPGFDDLGNRVLLVYVPQAEL